MHPEVKVGAYGGSGLHRAWDPDFSGKAKTYRLPFFRNFFRYLKATATPIDFFSWHSYNSTKDTVRQDRFLHEELTALGYGDLETHLNEWDPFAEEFGTAHHSAEMTAMMIAMQNAHPAVCCVYDMRTTNAPYCPLFDPITHKPIQGYYSMVAFNALYRLGTQVSLTCDTDDLYALVATNGTAHALLLSNLTGTRQPFTVTGADLSHARYHVIDGERLLSWSPVVDQLENNTVLLIEF